LQLLTCYDLAEWDCLKIENVLLNVSIWAIWAMVLKLRKMRAPCVYVAVQHSQSKKRSRNVLSNIGNISNGKKLARRFTDYAPIVT
jgi:hypothetical protein